MGQVKGFNDIIADYLKQRAEEDTLFAPKFANPNKSIDECCRYILGEARKRGTAVAMSDSEVFGMAMHHCVYQNGYHRRPECLILSAKDTAGKRLETIEVNLKTLDIVQSRSFCNGVSEYHDQIVKLVKKNMNLIRRKMIA